MKNFRTIILFIVFSLAASSCTEKFFQQYPSNSITEGNFYQTEDDFNKAVLGCYTKLKTEMAWHLTELAYRTEECRLESMTVSESDRYHMDHFSENSSNSTLAAVWDAWYNGIYRCNDVLGHMEGKDFANVGKFKGELLFMRSWFYFNLYRTFGVVPITKVVVTPEESKKIPRCTEDQMYELLCSDLTEAAKLLPEARSAEVARVTKIAAYTLLGKVQLTFKKNAEAKKTLEDALKQPGYGLEASTAAVFDVKNKMNKEIIFALYYDKGIDKGHGVWYSGNSVADFKNPKDEFRTIYAKEDNRLELITPGFKVADKRFTLYKWADVWHETYQSIETDFPHLRYADLVLLYAEACYRNNDIANANLYLNKTRTRAGLESKDFSGDAFLRELADERGRELALEGQRWYDLVRLGLAEEILGAQGMKAHNVLFPIPLHQLEIINNEEILWQNSGF